MPTRSDIAHRIALWFLGLAVAALVGWVVWEGRDYYRTPVPDRPRHEDYREFRPAGFVGHGVGVLGSAMVMLLLLYSLRKRWKRMRRVGQLRHWLRYHIFLGVAGPVLITLHSSFKISGLVAISYWSMVAVALSGVFGRYLYQQIPRNVLGDALTPDVVETRNEAILVELAERFGVNQKALDALDHLALRRITGRPAAWALLMLPASNLYVSRRIRRWSDEHGIPDAPDVVRLTREWVLSVRRLFLFHQVRDLFHWWHVFHKPFAIIMVLVMLVHVAVVVAFGYTWIFGAGS